MDQDLVQKDIGGEGELVLKIKDGNLLISVMHDGKGSGGGLEYVVKTDYFLDKLAALIPGQIDDAIINIMKAALKS